MLSQTDGYNKTLENSHSQAILTRLLGTIPDLVEEDQDEHYDMAKKLLVHAEDQNKRLDNNYKNACKILELWIDLAN